MTRYNFQRFIEVVEMYHETASFARNDRKVVDALLWGEVKGSPGKR